jgi:hypothetical protein
MSDTMEHILDVCRVASASAFLPITGLHIQYIDTEASDVCKIAVITLKNNFTPS